MNAQNGLKVYVGDVWQVAGNFHIILNRRISNAFPDLNEFESYDLTNQKRSVLMFSSHPHVYSLIDCLEVHDRLETGD